MIAAAVAELQLVGLSAEGQAEELMAEADTEDGNLPDEMADVLLCIRDRLGIARTVGEQHTVVLLGQDFIGMRGGGKDGDFAVLLRELAEDGALDAEGVDGNAAAGLGGLVPERVGTKGRPA